MKKLSINDVIETIDGDLLWIGDLTPTQKDRVRKANTFNWLVTQPRQPRQERAAAAAA